MKQPTSDPITKVCLFALPSLWPMAVFFIVLVIWREGFLFDLIPVTLAGIAMIVAAILLMKNHDWVCLPMIVLGIYIASQADPFVGHILRLFDTYMILHYLACGVYVYQNRRGAGPGEAKALAAIIWITLIFTLSLLLFG